MIRNFRDLGGISTQCGREIPSGLLFRSANLSTATDEDLDRISTVIDLRTATGRERWPDRLPQHVAYHPIPIFDEATAGITREASLDSVPDMVSPLQEDGCLMSAHHTVCPLHHILS